MEGSLGGNTLVSSSSPFNGSDTVVEGSSLTRSTSCNGQQGVLLQSCQGGLKLTFNDAVDVLVTTGSALSGDAVNLVDLRCQLAGRGLADVQQEDDVLAECENVIAHNMNGTCLTDDDRPPFCDVYA